MLTTEQTAKTLVDYEVQVLKGISEGTIVWGAAVGAATATLRSRGLLNMQNQLTEKGREVLAYLNRNLIVE